MIKDSKTKPFKKNIDQTIVDPLFLSLSLSLSLQMVIRILSLKNSLFFFVIVVVSSQRRSGFLTTTAQPMSDESPDEVVDVDEGVAEVETELELPGGGQRGAGGGEADDGEPHQLGVDGEEHAQVRLQGGAERS